MSPTRRTASGPLPTNTLIHGFDDVDSEWHRTRALVTYLDCNDVTVRITAACQDEQTGGRGPASIFDHLTCGIAKRLVLVNGEHEIRGTARHVQRKVRRR